jgi:hypothetical protein
MLSLGSPPAGARVEPGAGSDGDRELATTGGAQRRGAREGRRRTRLACGADVARPAPVGGPPASAQKPPGRFGAGSLRLSTKLGAGIV